MRVAAIESEYVKQARELLERFGVAFSVVLVGDDCPSFCEDARAGCDMGKIKYQLEINQ